MPKYTTTHNAHNQLRISHQIECTNQSASKKGIPNTLDVGLVGKEETQHNHKQAETLSHVFNSIRIKAPHQFRVRVCQVFRVHNSHNWEGKRSFVKTNHPQYTPS